MPGQRKSLKLTRARENNLKDISLDIEHDSLTVVTGLSGSGKSSLAFDTVYAEGQRRYIETFSPYTRQFFDKVKKPDVDAMDQVRPAVAIQQRTRILGSRSTVGSLTNINDYLKLLWSNIAIPLCPDCDKELRADSPSSVADWVLRFHALKPHVSLFITASVRFETPKPPLSRRKKKSQKPQPDLNIAPSVIQSCLRELTKLGFSRYFNPEAGTVESLEGQEDPKLGPDNRLLVVLDRVKPATYETSKVSKKRLEDSVDQAFSLAHQKLPDGATAEARCVIIEISGDRPRSLCRIENIPEQPNRPVLPFTLHIFAPQFLCEHNLCHVQKARPALFSFNHPYGACPTCKGFGRNLEVDPNLCVPNPSRSIEQKAIQCWAGSAAKLEYRDLLKFCQRENIPTDIPWHDIPESQRQLIFQHKSKDYWGVLPWFKWLERKTYKMHVRVFLSRYRSQVVCGTCNGTRLKADALAYRIAGKTIADIWRSPIHAVTTWLEDYMNRHKNLARPVIELCKSILTRLVCLRDLGLPYLTLDRQARTLSGGETQRVNLATALGSDLISTQFVLDEPSVGLHPRDTERLIRSVRALSEAGNSVLVVEHDIECIRAADNIIELGPLAGERGGQVVYSGSAAKWKPFPIVAPEPRSAKPSPKSSQLRIVNATARNLKNLDFAIPLKQFVCLTGVSGSGKSTLVQEVIRKAYEHYSMGLVPSSKTDLVNGFEHVSQVAIVDQSPLAKSPRANIATYAGIWERVRTLLASTDDAMSRALTKSAFSFNVDGGRCPHCKGAGFLREDMQFLSDVYIPCEFCLGQRFQPAVLEVQLRGSNVAELLRMSIEACVEFFHSAPEIVSAARTLCQLGLGHLTLGHPLSELSGGEAQRLKLVPFIEQSATGNALLIFDEPTTGLHHFDVERLVELFHLLRKRGNSIVTIEHNLSLIAACDWIIDLGPEGGELGGYLLKQGPPSDFVESPDSSSTAFHLHHFVTEYNKGIPSKSKARQKSRSPSTEQQLEIRGAREHNLKNIDIRVPLNQIVALTGVSGSGKSSIAKDIIYAEGQRRYLDCLSPYARQFIKELKRPDIDEIKNVKPTICVYQHTFQPSRLSTVATMSEIYNFLRLLFAKAAEQYCPDHPTHRIAALSPTDMAKEIKAISEKTVRLLAPVIKMKKGNHRAVFERALSANISQLRVDGVFLSPSSLNLSGGLEKNKVHSIDFVVAKFDPSNMSVDLIEEGVKQALSLSGGTLIIHTDKRESILSSDRTCPVCKRGFFKPDPEDLSFNSKRGACKKCEGRGHLENGQVCKECSGSRLQEIGRNLRINGETIYDLSCRSARELKLFFQSDAFSSNAHKITAPILKELLARSAALSELGLDYIKLSRDCTTLSSGELQRLRIATAMGTQLSGVLYIFDEPSAGLHPLDNRRVLKRLTELRDGGNSIIVIEHDPESILSADYVLDVGPRGGRGGGTIVFEGPRSEFIENNISPTALALRSKESLTPPDLHSTDTLKVSLSSVNNIKSLSLSIPLGCLVSVIGVSGAGKSTLVHHGIADTIRDEPGKKTRWSSSIAEVTSSCEITRVLEVDQKPIGINSRSTPASYLKIWDDIRRLYASTPEAKARGWKEGFFSYNAGKGRCPECKGLGAIKLEMNFLPDASMPCETCAGSRFTEAALEIRYLGLSVAEVLSLTFEEARTLYANHRKIHQALHVACELGLGYLTLGQSSVTLSGGESQRIKLVSELSGRPRGHSLYILDEPTTGLHMSDVRLLVKTLHELVARGNSILVIEHDKDVIMASQHVIELGPGAGEQGGKVVYQGVPQGLLRASTPWADILTGSETKTRQSSIEARLTEDQPSRI